MPTIKLKDQEFEYDCETADTLLRSALRAGLGFPYECNSGGCGSCKFELIDGEVEELWPDAPGLNKRDIRKGKKLACQCRPKGDCTIKVNLEHHAVPEIKPKKFTVTYTGRHDLTADMAEFCFTADSPAHFEAGQYVSMALPGVQGDRGYSMSNTANEEGQWQFIVKKMPDGKGSGYLFDQLQTGDTLELDGPYGLAYLKTEIPRNIVCIGGGSGLSPIMSIVRAATSDKRLNDRKIHMFYGGRGPRDICTPELVAELADSGAELICENVVSDAELAAADHWDGECSFVHELVDKRLSGSMPDYEFYFCGPPPMTEAVQRMLMIDHKVPFEQIHFDRFF